MRFRRRGGTAGKRLTRVLIVVALAVAGLVVALVTSAGAAGTGDSSPVNPASSNSASSNPFASGVTAQRRAGTDSAIAVLQATIAPDSALLHDGDGIATVTLADVSSTDTSIAGLKAVMRVPRPALASGVVGSPGWKCAVAPGGMLECRPTATIIRSSSPAPINVDIKAAGKGSARLTVHATWSQPGPNGRPVDQATSAALKVYERAPLAVRASAVEKTVTDPVAGIPTTPVILQGTVGRRTPEPIRVRWRQLCGRGPCSSVQWTTPIAGLLVDGQQPEAAFKPPSVTRPEVLRFELTASDPRGSVSAVTTVRVLPDEIQHLNPNLKSVTLGGTQLHANGTPVGRLRLPKSVQTGVSVGTSDASQTTVNGMVSLTARVTGQGLRSVRWRVAIGPPSMLAGARRRGATIRFRAPGIPGTYAVRMTATTAAGSFSRDQLIDVVPGGAARAAVASAAAVAPEAESAFCKVVRAVRQTGKISISLPAGGTFEARPNEPPGAECSKVNEIRFHGGTSTLGSFQLADVEGTITEAKGLVIERGTLVTPAFWTKQTESATDSSVHLVHGRLAARAADDGGGLRIAFAVPTTQGVSARLGIPLGRDGFGDLTGSLEIDESLLSKFPIASSLPFGWKMTGISLSVLPEARRFELTANAKGPAAANNTGGEISFYGTLTFDGQASVSVTASNLAVFASAGGQQATLTASGTLTLLPGQKLDPNNPNATGSFFPVIDVEVSAKIENYKPAENVTLSGSVSWSSGGSLDVEGELVVTVKKGHDIRTTVSGSYTDAQNWKLFASLDAGADGLKIGSNPSLLTLNTLEGELSRSGGKLDFSVKGEASDIHVFENVDVKTATVAFTSACKFANQAQPAAETGALVCLEVEADFAVKLPGAKAGEKPLEVTGSGKLDLGTLKFEATGKVTKEFGPAALHLHDVQLSVTNVPPAAADCAAGATAASAGGVYFVIEANATVLGLPLNVKGVYLGGDKPEYCLRATIASASLPEGNSDQLKKDAAPAASGCTLPSDPSLQNLTFDYSSETKVAEFTGKFCLPSWVRQKLGDAGTQQGTFNIKLSEDGFEGKATYARTPTKWFLNALPNNTPDPSKAALGFNGLGVEVNATRSKGLSVGLNAEGEISLPAPTAATGGAGAASRADVSLGVDATLLPEPELAFSVVIGGQKIDPKTPQPPCNRQTPGRLTNVFGAPGFDICQLGVSGSIKPTGPSIAVNARFLLPDSWSDKLGTQNASFAIGFNISASTPCVDVTIAKADANSQKPAIDLLNRGAIEADLAQLQIAPNGCKLPGGQQIPAGMELAFRGVMFGTGTDLSLKIERQPAGVKIDFSQHVPASALGPLKFGASDIRVLVDPANNRTTLGLKTSLAVGSGKFSFDGQFDRAGNTTTLNATTSMHAQFLAAKFDGSAQLNFRSGPGGTRADFTGSVNLDIVVMKIGIEINKLTYDSGAGGLQEIDMKADTDFNLGPVEGRIGGSLTWSRGAQELGLGLTGRVKVWGFETSFDLPAKLSTNIRLPFEFGPGTNTTRLSEPRTLLVLRLKGKLDGHVERDGAVAVDHVLPIQGCFPFETVCVNIGDAHVNTANGTVKFKVFGYDVVIDASKYVKSTPGQVDYSPGISYLANQNSGKCADVPFADFRDGKRLKQVDCSRTRNIAQEFKLLSDGTLRVRNQEGREFCVSGINRQVQLANCDPRNRQDEIWIRDDHGRLRGEDTSTLKPGQVSLCLEVPGASKVNDTLLALADCTDAENQRWVIVDLIRHPGRAGCLDVPGGDLASALKLYHACNRTPNQAFALYPNGELKVRGQCVAAEIRTGATVKLENCGAAPAPQQRWSFQDGQLCVGEYNARSGVFPQCMTPLGRQGDYYPVEVRRFDRDVNQKWDVTY